MTRQGPDYGQGDIASKVLRTDRRLLDDQRRESNVNSNPQSIKEHKEEIRFGSALVNHERPTTSREEVESQLAQFDKKGKLKKKKLTVRGQNKAKSLLDSSIQELTYTPTTESNVHTHGLILTWCSERLQNDVSEDVVASLADIIIELLKSESNTSLQKKKDVEDVIGKSLDEDQFLQLYDLVQKITDYQVNDLDDDELGVVIDDDEDEEDEEDGGEDESEYSENDADRPDELPLFDQNLVDQSTVVQLMASADDSAAAYLDVKSINRFWLSGELIKNNPGMDNIKQSHVIDEILKALADFVAKNITLKELDDILSSIAELENGDLLTTIMKNYYKIHYAIKLSDDESQKEQIYTELESHNLLPLLNEFKGKRSRDEEFDDNHKKLKLDFNSEFVKPKLEYPKYIDLNNLKFTQGSHLMTTSSFQLPEGSFKRSKKSWDEIHIPPPTKAKMCDDERLIQISELPQWAQQVFPSNETTSLNRIQSKVYPSAFLDDGNILMCAPTGAGKTNVAMLAILNIMAKYRSSSGSFKLDDFKIVFIAPLKALVQEQVREFDRRLKQFGVVVNELTGDSNLTKHQISQTQILVTTPEKWDVITRKQNDASFVQLVKLVIIDEIHLLHDERGPVLESIVARQINDNVRFVALSATLPNYKDVAKFLKVQPKDLFYFDATYRPCPLAQQFIGITEKKAFKKYEAMNEVCYEKVVENINAGHQVIIFVHSRKETEKTAKAIVEKILSNDKLKELMNFSVGVNEILKSESSNATNKALKEVLPMGLGIHHAGMTREDRSTSEDLFAEGHIKVLVSTATLAWGVNLPAHTVIIKGTSVYSPEKGSWTNLSPQDILQMLGRAGRPRYDTHGEGIIITDQDEVKYYLAILNQQLPIESQMYAQLADSINAEIVLGTIRSLKDVMNWISHTYLFIRMLHSRSIYHITEEYDDDKDLVRRRRDLGYSALVVLAKHGLIKYNFAKDLIVSTDLGKIASYYYISYSSIKKYSDQVQPHFSEIELFRIFASSEEFKYIPIRKEEKIELKKLMESSPVPINETVEDPLAKVNILLQAYISKLKLDGFALMADMVYVVQSAGRLFRAMYDLALRKKWSRLAKTLLDICKMIERRLWLTHSPLRQFDDVPREIIQVSERSMTPWKYYLALNDPKLAIQAFKAGKFGNLIWDLLQKFPQLNITHNTKPITPSLLMIQLELTPSWRWDTDVHGFSESFVLLVEDCDSEKVLFSETFIVSKDSINQVHTFDLTVPLFETEQPNYFISVISEKWLHCGVREPIMLTHLNPPAKFPASTLLDPENKLVSVKDLGVEEFIKVFSFDYFNKFQSDAFDAVYNTDRNVLFNTSKGNGKTVIGELALLNHWKNERGRAIYISPYQEQIDLLLKKWQKKFASLAGGKVINKLTGDITHDLKLLSKSHLLLGTISQFDLLTRRWKQRRNLQSIELIIGDDIHVIGDGKIGVEYENLISRLRYMQINLESEIRFVCTGSPLASYKDVADWLDVPKHFVFNYGCKERVYPVEVQFIKFDIMHVPSLIKCCIRPAYDAINAMEEIKGEERAVVFLSSRKQCLDVSKEFIARLKMDNLDWLKTDKNSLQSYLRKIDDPKLFDVLKYGIAVYYSGMSSNDKLIVEKLFNAGALTCLLATKDTSSYCPVGHLVCVITTKDYQGKEKRFVDYKINDLIEMVGCSRLDNGKLAKVLVLTNSSKLDYYKKFLAFALPMESHLNYYLHDKLLTDINFKLVKNRQEAVDILTYSLFYRRLQLNPSFYGLKDASDDSLIEYLSELVENTLNDLSEAKTIELNINDDDEEEEDEEEKDDVVEIVPNTHCIIGAHYGISFVTLQILIQSLNAQTNVKSLMEIICQADEFNEIPIRLGEDGILTRVYNSLPVKYTSDDNEDFHSPNFKAFILLQAHISRISLNPDLVSDVKFILGKVISILNACVDILSSESHLSALKAMDLSQMVVQGMWQTESSLKQLPFFDDQSILKKCESLDVKSVYDFMELEDSQRDDLLGSFDEEQVESIANFVNKYPNLDVSIEDVPSKGVSGELREIVVNIERDEDVEDSVVEFSQFPNTKYESWWVVLGDPDSKELYAIKKTELLAEKQQIKLKFSVPAAGKRRFSVWVVSDCFLDADRQVEVDEIDFE